jgi:hypothetical protein
MKTAYGRLEIVRLQWFLESVDSKIIIMDIKRHLKDTEWEALDL